jgi:predicted histone-like DNA-binding protein
MYETPVPKGRKGKKTKHARVVSETKMDMGRLCKLVSEGSSFSSADVKGVLASLQQWMEIFLSEGSTVELEGLGHFYPTLKSHTVVDKNGKATVYVAVDSVGFRCSPKLKKLVRQAKLEYRKRTETKQVPEQCKERILSYVRKNISITTRAAQTLNGYSAYMAANDLKELVAEGKLLKAGKSRLTVFILPYGDEEKIQNE